MDVAGKKYAQTWQGESWLGLVSLDIRLKVVQVF